MYPFCTCSLFCPPFPGQIYNIQIHGCPPTLNGKLHVNMETHWRLLCQVLPCTHALRHTDKNNLKTLTVRYEFVSIMLPHRSLLTASINKSLPVNETFSTLWIIMVRFPLIILFFSMHQHPGKFCTQQKWRENSWDQPGLISCKLHTFGKRKWIEQYWKERVWGNTLSNVMQP